jgi:hypothetical protein
MFIEPGIQVNAVEHTPTTEPDAGHIELRQERHPDAEIHRRLFFGQATHRGQRQVCLIHQ